MQFPFSVPASAEFDVFGFGTNAVDFLISVPKFPDFASKVELSNYTRSAGGEIASTCVGLQRLGYRTAYCGRFGDDDAGTFGKASVSDEGVDISYSETIADTETQIAFIVIDQQTGERTVIWKRDARLSFAAEEAPIDAIKRCRVLHMTHHDTEACIRLASEAREHGIPVSLDVDNVVEGIDRLLPLVDVLIASAEFPGRSTGIADSRAALIELHSRFKNAVIGTTLGEKGSLIYCNGEFVETDGFAVPGGCKDTTGAGDAFRVGLLAGLLQGTSVEEAARMANAVAALKCRAIGARTSLPTSDELNSFLK
jgi:sulfofructose kinase